MLAMFEPRALPMASDGLPCNEAVAETIISGAEVPKPTMVRPTTRVETPKLRASADAPATRRSAAQMSSTNPASICNDAMVMVMPGLR